MLHSAAVIASRWWVVAAWLVAAQSWAGVTVPLEISVGPAGYWFTGALLDNRGAVPHFGLQLDIAAIIDKELIDQNFDRIPPKYRSLAKGVTEARIGPSIFIPSALIISPRIDALGGVGMYGVSWTPLGLTLLSTGQSSSREWNQTRGRFFLNASLLLTYLFIHSDLPQVPTTHFLRPGVQLEATILLNVTKTFLISLNGGAQAYLPQHLGDFGFGPFNESVVFAFFASLKFHQRVPYDIAL